MQRVRTLVIDDNISFLEMVSLFLEQSGYQVAKARSIPDALHELRNKSFEYVITDLRVGDRSGVEVVNHLTSHKDKSVLIVMTAHINDIEIAKICSFARAILVKPFPLQELVVALSQRPI